MFSFFSLPKRHHGLNINFYQKVMGGAADSGFTLFRIKPEFKCEKSDKEYKLHLNFDNESYIRCREAIIACIDELAYLRAIYSFKYFDFTSETLSYNFVYRDFLREMKILECLKKEDEVGARKIADDIFTDNEKKWTKETFRIFNAGQLNYEMESEQLEVAKKQTERFIGQTQFTLYLSTPIDENRLRIFFILLNQKLQALGIRPGSVPNTDVMLTPYISFRKIRLDGSYLGGAGVDAVKHQKNLQKLKEEAVTSSAYKVLAGAAKDQKISPEELDAMSTDAWPSLELKLRATGQFSRVPAQCAPIDQYQNGENKFIQKDYEGAYKDYRQGYHDLCQSKKLSAREEKLKFAFEYKMVMLIQMHPDLPTRLALKF
jgi:hypothetical protein